MPVWGSLGPRGARRSSAQAPNCQLLSPPSPATQCPCGRVSGERRPVPAILHFGAGAAGDRNDSRGQGSRAGVNREHPPVRPAGTGAFPRQGRSSRETAL